MCFHYSTMADPSAPSVVPVSASLLQDFVLSSLKVDGSNLVPYDIVYDFEIDILESETANSTSFQIVDFIGSDRVQAFLGKFSAARLTGLKLEVFPVSSDLDFSFRLFPKSAQVLGSYLTSVKAFSAPGSSVMFFRSKTTALVSTLVPLSMPPELHTDVLSGIMSNAPQVCLGVSYRYNSAGGTTNSWSACTVHMRLTISAMVVGYGLRA